MSNPTGDALIAAAEFRGVPENDIIDRIQDGESIASLAGEFGVNRSTLCRWLDSDPQRSARVLSARRQAAAAWDEKAESEIYAASDQFSLAKAKELAHHFRWRSSKTDPARYGDKVEQVHTGTVGIERITRTVVRPNEEER